MRPGGSATGSVDTSLAGFAGSVDTPLAGFAGGLRRRGSRIAIPAAFEVRAGGLAPDAGRVFDAAERPSEPPQGEDLLLLVVSQDVGHPGGGSQVPPPRHVLGASLPHWPVFRYPRLAGFHVSTEDGAVEYAWRSFLGPD